MFQELIEIMTAFAKERDLIFTFKYIPKEARYSIDFKNQNKTFGYQTVISEVQLESYNMSVENLANHILDCCRRKLKYVQEI